MSCCAASRPPYAHLSPTESKKDQEGFTIPLSPSHAGVEGKHGISLFRYHQPLLPGAVGQGVQLPREGVLRLQETSLPGGGPQRGGAWSWTCPLLVPCHPSLLLGRRPCSPQNGASTASESDPAPPPAKEPGPDPLPSWQNPARITFLKKGMRLPWGGGVVTLLTLVLAEPLCSPSSASSSSSSRGSSSKAKLVISLPGPQSGDRREARWGGVGWTWRHKYGRQGRGGEKRKKK